MKPYPQCPRFGREFKQARWELGLSVSEMADILDVRQTSTIRRWENDHNDVVRYAWDFLYLALTPERPLLAGEMARIILELQEFDGGISDATC